MSIGPTSGILGSAAGAPLSQTKGAEAERQHQLGAQSDRKADSEVRAEKAAGIGQTEEDQGTGDRDADGRRMWETPEEESEEDAQGPVLDTPPDHQTQKSKDATGEAGTQLDLTG